jgi:inorganic pyrophosphatase
MFTISIEKDKIYLKKYDENISFLNDIEYKSETFYNMICEIPKDTSAKMEINLNIEFNPIIQDKINGKPRFYRYGNIPWNYGAIPQTFEDTEHNFKETGLPGDGDPIDIIDIGTKKFNIGEIIKVKILGVVPLIDEGETDWKIIGININDNNFNNYNDINDIPKEEISRILDWFKNYKYNSKGIINKIAMNGNVQNREFAKKIIDIGHFHWVKKIKKL